MEVKYNGSSLGANNVRWTQSRGITRDGRNNRRTLTEKIQLDGFVKADDQASLKAEIDNIKSIFAVDGGDLILYHNDGTTVSSHAIYSAATITGVLVESGPDFPLGGGAEYALERNYSVTLTADIETPNLDELVAFQEVIRFTGTGGAKRVGVEFITGAAEVQVVSQKSLVFAQQSGSAVGRTGYPYFAIQPHPMLASYESENRRTEAPGTPEFTGQAFRNFPIAWTFDFVAPALPAPAPIAR